ncbi:MAG: hypothetical protein ACLFUI_10240 [Halanaerobiales bacterium]
MKKLLTSIFVIILISVFTVNTAAIDKLITVPSAEITGGQGYILGELVGSSSRHFEGVYNVNTRVSVGGIISFIDNEETDLGFLLKGVLLEETEDGPMVSAGIRMKDLYLVTSKEIGMGIRGHVGIGDGDIDGLFIGFNKVLNPLTISQGNNSTLPLMNLMGEYVNEQVNLGLRMTLQDNMKVDLGLLDFDELKLGIGYTF